MPRSARSFARAPLLTAALLAPLLALSGCRKPAPEERVYTGGPAPPFSPSAGGSGGSGTMPGAGGTPSAGAGNEPSGEGGSGGQGGKPATPFSKRALLEAA